MKPKEKTTQYQTVSAKDWRKVVFSEENKFNLGGPDGFQKYAKYFPEENYSTKRSEGGFFMILGHLHLQENLNYNLSVVDKKQQII